MEIENKYITKGKTSWNFISASGAFWKGRWPIYTFNIHMSRTKTVSVEWRHKDWPPLKKRTLNLLNGQNAQRLWEFQGILFFHLVKEQWTINTAYYSKLLKEGTQPAFRPKRQGQSVKSGCLLHDNTRAHTAAMTAGTLEETRREFVLCPVYS
jgi:hypothetical protein